MPTQSPSRLPSPFKPWFPLALIVAACLSGPLHRSEAQERQFTGLQFTELKAKGNDTVGSIHAITQGPSNFIWFGTSRGAMRYDGYELELYVNDADDPNSLAHDVIWSMHLDRQNRLWFGTRRGISRYEPSTDSFENFLLNPDDPHSNISNRCNAFAEDEQGNLFASTESGIVYRFDPQQNRFAALNSVSFGVIKSMDLDPAGTLWIGSDAVAHSFHPETQRIRRYEKGFETPDGASVNFLYSVIAVDASSIWFATSYDGVVVLDSESGELTPLETKTKRERRAQSLHRQAPGQIWVCRSGGVTVYDIATRRLLESFDSNSSREDSLPVGNIQTLYVDHQQNVWVGSKRRGVYVSAHDKKFYRSLPLAPTKAEYRKPVITQVFTDSKGRIWVGYASGGIEVRNGANQFQFDIVFDDSSPRSIGAFAVYDIFEAKDGTIWVGTFNGGLQRFNETTRDFDTFTHDPADENTIAVNDVRGIAEDADGNLWLALKGGGVSRFDPRTGTARNYKTDPFDTERSILNNWPSDIEVCREGKIYVATPIGLSIFDPAKGHFENFTPQDNDPTSLSNAHCQDLYQDSQGRIWIGTSDGLNLFHSETKTFSRYRKRDGMPSHQVLAIVEDLEGRIWAGTDDGLARLDPRSGEIKTYDRLDGLIHDAFLPDSVTRDSKGSLYFGQNSGISHFTPSEIEENTRPPNVFVTDVRVFFKSIYHGESANELGMQRYMPGDRSITIDHDKKVLTIEYVAQNYIQPQKNQYAYRLIGFDTDWNYVGSRRDANYTNLNPGKYTFQVKASNNDGYWNEDGATLEIVITPPYWRTPLFYFLLAVVVIGSGYLFIRLRERRLKQDRLRLETLVEERTALVRSQNQELEAQRSQLELQRDELAAHRDQLESKVAARTLELLAAKDHAEESDRLKSSFLANLSHEIRTPLNAVVGFSNLLRMGDYDDNERNEYVDIIDENSKSLLRLIDDILDFSMIESNQVTIFEETFPFNDFFESVANAHILALAEAEGKAKVRFTPHNDIASEAFVVHSDRQRIKQIVDNLLTNAVKFTDAGSIELRAEKDSDWVTLSVTDTGKGIAAKHLDLIFEQFYRIQEDERMARRGVGLGLAICKRLAKLLGGDLKVESAAGQGSRFYLELPIAKFENTHDSNRRELQELHRSETRSLAGKRILVIEDEENNYKFLEAALKRYDIELAWALNGEEGVSLFRSQGPFDMVLLDIKLPSMDGFEVHARLRSIEPNAVIVAQTAYSMKGDEYRIRTAGFTDYISKPIAVARLDEILKQYLG